MQDKMNLPCFRVVDSSVMHIFKRLALPVFLILPAIILFSGQAFGHGMSEAEKQSILAGANLQYLKLGATHMLSGFDHLLFVFGIVFVLTKFRDIVKYITVFTIGHSITLIGATFLGLQVNYFLIDAVIALSVCYIAFANMDGFKKILGIATPNMLAMIFSLGLIHGLGLSTRLQQLPLNKDQLLMNILSFNVGVELGQVAALALMLVLIAGFRKSHHFKPFSQITNFFLIFAGGALFLMQMHGYEHSFGGNQETASLSASKKKGDISSQSPNKGLPYPVANKPDKKLWKQHVVKVTIPINGDSEYKVLLAKGAVLDYDWKTAGTALYFDFHGEPTGDKTGFFRSFKKSTAAAESGTLVTEFAGTHGWYWKNKSLDPVTITLKIMGEYKRLEE